MRSLVAVLVLVLVAACGGGSGDPDATGDPATTAVAGDRDDTPTSTTTSTTSTSTTPPPADPVVEAEQLASDAVLDADDLTPGWHECCETGPAPPEELTEHPCGAPEGLPASLARFQRQLAYEDDGEIRGMITATATVHVDEAAAAAAMSAVGTEPDAQCVVAETEAGIMGRQAAGASGATTAHQHVVLPMAVSATADRMVTRFRSPESRGWVNTDLVRFRSGRITYRLAVESYHLPFAPADLAAYAENLLDEVPRERTG